MGNAPSSKLLSQSQPPSKPFDKTKASCLAQSLIIAPKHVDTNTTLQQLILRQDWQRVLIRASLFPSELSKPFVMNLYDIEMKVTPLHLVCALDPPAVVVQLFLKHYIDAAATPLRPLLETKNFKSKRGLRGRQQERTTRRYTYSRHHKGSSFQHVQLRWREWRRYRKGAFPTTAASTGDSEDWYSVVDDLSLEQRQFLLPHAGPGRVVSSVDASSGCYLPPHEENIEEESRSDKNSGASIGSSLSSKTNDDGSNPMKDDSNVILQLSPSGGLTPLLIQTSDSVDSSSTEESQSRGSDTSDSSIFCVTWDLEPLEREIQRRGVLLPLHVACLYSANVSVLEVLLQAYPLAALADVLGMLPLHLVAGGWNVPPLLRPPLTSLVTKDMIEPKPTGPLLSLKVLRKIAPESLDVRSGNHGMAAEDYIKECMREGEYKESCMRALASGPVYELDCGSSYGGSLDKTLIFVDSNASSNTNDNDNEDDDQLCAAVGGCYYIAQHDSGQESNRHCLVAGLSGMIVEQKWAQALTLVENDSSSASKYHYGVDEDPTGASPPLVWKRLPIHLACAHGTPVGFLETLLKACPECASVEDPHDGCLPLHIAVRSRATLPIVKCLLRACPEATMAINRLGQVPLHVAALVQAPYTVLECLVSSDPESVTCSDACGKTPIDYAVAVGGVDSITARFLTMILLLLERRTTV